MINPYKLFRYKYPKLTLLVVCIIAAYILFERGLFDGVFNSFSGLGLFSVFIAGILFTFGFTAPFAVAYFVALNPSNLVFVGLLGGLGALCGDMAIFHFVKFSFTSEFNKLKRERLIGRMRRLFGSGFLGNLGHYLTILFAGFIIASPLPDELGVTLIAGLSKINRFWLGALSFILNTIGIIVLMSL